MAKARRIVQYDRMGNILQTFPNIKTAAMITGVGVPGISRCCNGKRDVAGGYVWSFEGEEPNMDNVKPRILEYDVLGNYIATFDTVKNITETYSDLGEMGIRLCLNGEGRQYKNRIWLYENETDKLEQHMKDYGRQIIAKSLDKQTTKKFYSIQHASESLDVNRFLIARAIRDQAICRDFVWFKYYDEEAQRDFEEEKYFVAIFKKLEKLELVRKDGVREEYNSIAQMARETGYLPHTLWLHYHGFESRYSIPFKIQKRSEKH